MNKSDHNEFSRTNSPCNWWSKGIGKAICLALAKEKANIIIAARNDSEIKETMDELKKMDSKAIAIHVDVRNEEDVKNLVSRAVDEYGRLDILINNAGVAHKKRLEETTMEKYNEIMDTNLKGVFLWVPLQKLQNKHVNL